MIASLNHPNISTSTTSARDYARDGAGRGADARRPHRRRARCRSTRRSAIARQIADALDTRTRRASSIATSSRATSRSAPTASSRCWTSARQGPAGGRPVEVRRFADDHRRPDRGGDDSGHGGLHGARAGRGKDGGQARRHLGLRLRVLRDADRRAADQGDSSQETMASILRDEPDLDKVPVQARRLLKRCLEKRSTAAASPPPGTGCPFSRAPPRPPPRDPLPPTPPPASAPKNKGAWGPPRIDRIAGAALGRSGRRGERRRASPGGPLRGRANREDAVLLRRRDGRVARRPLDGVSSHR